jgi:hypothetical protein
MEDKNAQRRYQVVSISVPNPTTAGQVVEQALALDRDFNKIVGAAFHEIANGGIANNYQVGLRTDRKQWVDPVNIQNWSANTGVAIEGKFRKFGAGIGYGMGDQAYVQIIPGANTSAAMRGELVLLLERDLTEVPRM